MRIPIVSSLIETIREVTSRRGFQRKPNSVSVIVSTYNNPKWLEKLFWGYQNQHFFRVPYDIIIADDGSNEETSDLVASYKKKFDVDVKHIWHPDEGFRKCRILNKAIIASNAEYLIFTDQDCIPRSDFLENHYQYAEPRFYLSGGHVKLPMQISQNLTEEDILSERAFERTWLKKEHSFSASGFLERLEWNRSKAMWKNWLTTTSATANGNCFSVWRDDILTVNGFNEDLSYGGLDRELGDRLYNLGIKAKQLRYSLVCLHLDHKRPYSTKESWQKNKAIRKEVRRSGRYFTPRGISMHKIDEDNTDNSRDNVTIIFPEQKRIKPQVNRMLEDGSLSHTERQVGALWQEVG
jgi:GT2 family glycosyltransferase